MYYYQIVSISISLCYNIIKTIRLRNYLGDIFGSMMFARVNKKKLALVVFCVVVMGFCISFFNTLNFGTDPFTLFNLGMATKLGISLGNWQAIFNSALFVFVWFFAKEQIGLGTIASMFIVGYSYDFFTWLNGLWIPADFFHSMHHRVLVAIPIMALFILAVSVYVALQQGTAPYDATPYILYKANNKIPLRVWRIGWDLSICMIGILLGSKAGVVTFIMAFAFGPTISWIQANVVAKIWKE